MAIATTAAHVSRALDFYHKESIYFSIGKTTAWTNDANPPAPSVSDFKVQELVALKKINNKYLVVEDENGTITYRNNKWKIVADSISTTTSSAISSGATTIALTSLSNIVAGNKLRIGNIYDATIVTVNASNNTVVLNTAAPSNIPSGSNVLGGAYVEGARHVYIDCSLEYDTFPIVTYRQVGVQVGVTPNNADILKSASYSSSSSDEFTSLGTLEILDNRAPTVREADQRESVGLIIQF